MSHRRQLASDKVRPGAGLHHYDAARQVAEKMHHLCSRELLVKHLSARSVLAVQVKTVFTEIDTDQR
ncbi:hypothetical protein D3C84_844430 [compost metagenome]